MILLGFFWKNFHSPARVIRPVTAVALFFGVIDGLKVAGLDGFLPEALLNLPLSAQNLAWLIPSTIVLLICIVIDKVKH